MKAVLLLCLVAVVAVTADAVKEPITGISFETSLESGAQLAGVGARQKKIAFVNVNVYGVGLYVDAAGAKDKLAAFKGKSADDLRKDNGFYKAMIEGEFGKTYRLVMARDISASQMSDGLKEGVLPRLKALVGDKADGILKQLLDHFDSKLSKGTEVLFTMSPEGKFTVVANGAEKEGIDSKELCQAVSAVYMDEQSITPSARTGFAERIPAIIADAEMAVNPFTSSAVQKKDKSFNVGTAVAVNVGYLAVLAVVVVGTVFGTRFAMDAYNRRRRAQALPLDLA